MKTQDTTEPVLKKLTLKKETLRRLTPAELRLAVGGRLGGGGTWQSNGACC